jgi:cell division protein FtsB
MTNPNIEEFNEQLERTIRLLETQEEILESINRKQNQMKKDLSNDVPNFVLQRT